MTDTNQYKAKDSIYGCHWPLSRGPLPTFWLKALVPRIKMSRPAVRELVSYMQLRLQGPAQRPDETLPDHNNDNNNPDERGENREVRNPKKPFPWTMDAIPEPPPNEFQEFVASSVGRKLPNDWGLHDMLGNVSEWCADVALGVHRVRPYAIAEATDPVAVGPGAFRVTRGGSWSSRALAVRAASRRSASRLLRVPYYGFRLAAGALAPRT